MADDNLTPEALNVPTLKSVFDSAYLETKLDSDGDLMVRDGIWCFVLPTQSKERIQLMVLFGVKDGASRMSRLELTNRINARFAAVRASINDRGSLVLDYYVPVQGGIPRRTVVHATKFFLGASVGAIRECDTEDIIK